MTLAQVVYNISTDNEFARMWSNDPEAALAQRGLKLSREEMAFLSKGLQRKNSAQGPIALGSVDVINRVSWYTANSVAINRVSWYTAGGNDTERVSWYT